MDGMNPFSTDQWIQHYPNTPMAQSGGHEPSEPATTVPVHKDSSHGTAGQSGGGKPIRRRSRASRKTPTTLLNASPTDFRALVQRFTGCDSGANAGLPSSSAPSVVNLPKGPLNIDFGRNDVNESSSRYDYFNGQTQMRASSLPIGDFQGGYGMENANSVVYEPIDESSLMASGRDGGSHGY